MKTEIIKINPKEYGLEDTQVITIEQAFASKSQNVMGLLIFMSKL